MNKSDLYFLTQRESKGEIAVDRFNSDTSQTPVDAHEMISKYFASRGSGELCSAQT